MHVTIAGGGVAALECALALRDLAGERVALTLVAPEERFVYRPLSVGEPFALGDARMLALERFASDVSAELRPAALAAVDPGARSAKLSNGDEVSYDALVVAIGAHRVPAFDHVTTFRGQEDSEAVHGLIQDLEGGYVRRVAFVVPHGIAWPLPIYELALMAARRAYDLSLEGVEVTVVTPEESPLGVFGPQASADVRSMLEEAGIRFEGASRATVPAPGRVELHPNGRSIECDRIVALPQVVGIAIDGLPHDAGGFAPIDAHGRVRSAPGVYAAGDGTSFPVKQGGIACQQADAVGEAIAAEAGSGIDPEPFRPILRGELLTGSGPRYLRADLSGTGGDVSLSSEHVLWWPPAKVAGRYLAPYLDDADDRRRAAGVRHGGRRVALISPSVQRGHGFELLGFDVEPESSA